MRKLCYNFPTGVVSWLIMLTCLRVLVLAARLNFDDVHFQVWPPRLLRLLLFRLLRAKRGRVPALTRKVLSLLVVIPLGKSI